MSVWAKNIEKKHIPLLLNRCSNRARFFWGILYTQCAMGMLGSETALEEILNRVLGDLIPLGYVAKLADDLYIGGKNHLR